jgi:hypothetical protein
MYPRFYPPGSHWAMAGGTLAHDELIVNLIIALGTHLGRRGPCRVHSSDLKLKAGDHDYYPDAYVACGETQPRQTRLEDAVLVCEVRSQSTAEFAGATSSRSTNTCPVCPSTCCWTTAAGKPRCFARRTTEPGPIWSSPPAPACR